MDVFDFMEKQGIPRLDFVRGFSSQHISSPTIQNVQQAFKKTQHQTVTFACKDNARFIVAVHNTQRGPALGGLRLYDYKQETDAINDVLRLSEGMTYKSASVDLPFGGGKAIGWLNGKKNFEAFTELLVTFAGRYITGEDVGVGVRDMDFVYKRIKTVVPQPNVVGTSRKLGGCGDPSIATALGVFSGIKICVQQKLKQTNFKNLTIALQGAGKVGTPLGKMLLKTGARVFVTSRKKSSTKTLEKLGAVRVEPDEIYTTHCDVFCPAAIGGVINPITIQQLSCSIIAGPANNQLSDPNVSALLKKKHVLYAPDFVINAGGLIAAAHEYMARSQHKKFSWQAVERYLHVIPKNLERIFTTAQHQGISTAQAAVAFAKARL